MSAIRLRKAGGYRSRRVLRRLAVAAPLDLEAFRGCLERHTGRAVHITARNLAAVESSGVRFRTAGGDFLFYEQDTSPFHQAHILTCLAAHLLRDDELPDGPDPRLVPDVSPELVQLILGDMHQEPAADRDAEAFALWAMERAGVSVCPSSLARWFLKQIGPLCEALLEAVPEAAGQPGGDGRPSARERLHRQVIEIRDAALALRPFRTSDAVAAATAVARAGGLTGEPFAASVEAGVLAAAISAKKNGQLPARPADIWRPPFQARADLRGEAAWLAKVSRAFTRLPRVVRSPGATSPDITIAGDWHWDGRWTPDVRSVSDGRLDGRGVLGEGGKSRRDAWRAQS